MFERGEKVIIKSEGKYNNLKGFVVFTFASETYCAIKLLASHDTITFHKSQLKKCIDMFELWQ